MILSSLRTRFLLLCPPAVTASTIWSFTVSLVRHSINRCGASVQVDDVGTVQGLPPFSIPRSPRGDHGHGLPTWRSSSPGHHGLPMQSGRADRTAGETGEAWVTRVARLSPSSVVQVMAEDDRARTAVLLVWPWPGGARVKGHPGGATNTESIGSPPCHTGQIADSATTDCQH